MLVYHLKSVGMDNFVLEAQSKGNTTLLHIRVGLNSLSMWAVMSEPTGRGIHDVER